MALTASDFVGPTATRTTRYRVLGPRLVNGMMIWTVHRIVAGGRVGEQVGPVCFTKEDTLTLVDDIIKGKKVFYLGQTRFTRKPIENPDTPK